MNAQKRLMPHRHRPDRLVCHHALMALLSPARCGAPAPLLVLGTNALETVLETC